MAESKAQAQRRNYHYVADAMRKLEWDLHSTILREMRIPPAWHEIAQKKGDRPKRRVTIRIDEDVVKFFESMGTNWHPRINWVLSAWMHGRLAGLIDGPETMSYFREAKHHPLVEGATRPVWGQEHLDGEALGLPERLAWSGDGEGEGVPMGEDLGEDSKVRQWREAAMTLARKAAREG